MFYSFFFFFLKIIEILILLYCCTVATVHSSQYTSWVFFFLLCSFFVLLHSRKRSDSEDEEFAYKQSCTIVPNQPRSSFDWNSSCRRDQNYKPTTEYVGSSLSQIAEGKVLESSDQPRLILLHELFS